MESKFEIGEKIKNKRLQLNLRMDDVAKEVGITRSTLWSIENGNGNYTIDTLLKLLNFLNMSIDIDAQEQGTRRRATRTNSVLDKKINRFIVMCVEQYASSVNQSTNAVYFMLNKAGIINELKDDYEDMHGMSTYSTNEYIGKRLDVDVSQEPTNDNHILSKTILISQVIELIAKKYKLSIEEARNRFYSSKVIGMLDDDETGLYGESALYLLSLFDEQSKNKTNEEWTLNLTDDEWPLTTINHDRTIVRAIVIDEQENYYFARINRDDMFGKATLIETSGGGVEKDEDLETAIRRELKEELGANVDILCKIGVVNDYYNLINRHNINNYYLCKVVSFGDKHLTKDEIEAFHLVTLKLKYEDALAEYQKCRNTPLGRLLANREIPVLERARQIIANINK